MRVCGAVRGQAPANDPSTFRGRALLLQRDGRHGRSAGPGAVSHVWWDWRIEIPIGRAGAAARGSDGQVVRLARGDVVETKRAAVVIAALEMRERPIEIRTQRGVCVAGRAGAMNEDSYVTRSCSGTNPKTHGGPTVSSSSKPDGHG